MDSSIFQKWLVATCLLLAQSAHAADLKSSPSVDSYCLSVVRLMATSGESDRFEAQSEVEKSYAKSAQTRATQLFQSHFGFEVGFVELKMYRIPFGEHGAEVTVCDSDTGYEQGNCMNFTFRPSDSDNARLLVASEYWHIGDGKAYFVCE